MYRVVPLGSPRRVRTLLVGLVLLGLLGAAIPAAAGGHGAVSLPRPVGGAVTPAAHIPVSHAVSSPARSVATPSHLPSHPTSAAPHPAATGTGVFWEPSSAFTTQSYANAGCSSYSFTGYFSSTCYTQATSPTILNLANGNIGVVFTIYTNASSTTCLGSATSVTERVAFTVSSDGGHTFGPIQYLGNNTSCSYLDSIEPSFAVGGDGTIYGAYVEENYSSNQGYYYQRSTGVCCGYPSDALAFTVSKDNGTTFSNPVTLVTGGNISRPSLAAYGDSVYVMYENISNGTSTIQVGLYGYMYADPINENFLWSSNEGVSWSGPTIMPAQNAATYYDALGGTIAVSSTGLVGAAYFTNHSCPGYSPYYTCWASGDDLVYTTSSNNGTTWAPLVTVAYGLGESQYYMDGFYPNGYFQWIPSAMVTFDSSGTNAYIAFAGTYNKTMLAGLPFTYYYNWVNGGIWAAVGPASGSGFSVSAIATPLSTNNYDDNWNPSIAVNGGTIYVAWTTSNETYCYGSSCPFLDGTYSEWLRTSSNGGSTWSSPSLLDHANTCNYGYCSTSNAYSSFAGFSSSIGFSGSTPLVAYALPYAYQSTYAYVNGTSYYNYSYPTVLSIAQPWFGSTVSVNFTMNNLAVGTAWGITVNGQSFSTTDNFIVITNMPNGSAVSVSGNGVAAGWGTEAVPVLSIPSEYTFTSNTTVYVNYSISYLLGLSIEPTNPEYAQIWFYDHFGMYNYYEVYTNCPPCTSPNNYSNFPDGLYFPAGSVLELNSSANYGAFSYWTGNGNGAYNGAGRSANVTFNGPINETGWLGGFGSYNVSVTASGLPATSTFHFSLDGSSYSALASGWANVTNVGTGAHEITNVWATSSTAGWEYFGWPSPANPVIVPAETSVSLTFALVDLSTSPGTVSFQAQGLTAGTGWNFEFNGTVYNSLTPWINITTHSGTFPVHAFPVVSQNASVGYTPFGVSATWSVTTGTTYLISYVPAYKVQVVAGTGGRVIQGTGSFWVAQGGTASYQASANSGYGFGGWTGTGLGSYTGLSSYANVTANGPLVQTASFYPLPASRFNLTFTETGLAPGTWWTVFLGSSGFSSNQSSFQVMNLLSCSAPAGTGNYNLTIPYAYSADDLSRFIPTSHLAHSICTNGATVVNEVFAAQYLLTLQSTAGGVAEAQIGVTTTTTQAWVASGASVALSANAQTGYDFLGWNGTGTGSYTGPQITQGIVMAAPVTELATFQLHVNPPPPTFTLTFQEQQTLASGTVWGIVLGGTGYSTTSASLTVSGLAASTYSLSVPTALSPDGMTRYSSLGNVASVSVSHNASVRISFSTSFWVSISGTPGGTTSPASAWVTSGGSIFLNVTVFDGFQFLGWNGTGAASYTGPNPATSLTVSTPIAEVATFAPLPVHVSTTTGSSGLWTQPTTWIGLGLVGLLVGLVVGLIVSRRSGRQPPAPSAYEPPAESPPSEAPAAPPSGGSQ